MVRSDLLGGMDEKLNCWWKFVPVYLRLIYVYTENRIGGMKAPPTSHKSWVRTLCTWCHFFRNAKKNKAKNSFTAVAQELFCCPIQLYSPVSSLLSLSVRLRGVVSNPLCKSQQASGAGMRTRRRSSTSKSTCTTNKPIGFVLKKHTRTALKKDGDG